MRKILQQLFVATILFTSCVKEKEHTCHCIEYDFGSIKVAERRYAIKSPDADAASIACVAYETRPSVGKTAKCLLK